MMELTKVTMSKDRRKAIEAHVKVIMDHKKREFDKAVDKRQAFSDYVIQRIIGDFLYDAQSMKDVNKKMDLAHELYLDYMQVWEEKYGQN